MRYEYTISLKVDIDETDEEKRQLMVDVIRQAAQMIHAQACMVVQNGAREPQIAVAADDHYSDTFVINPFEGA